MWVPIDDENTMIYNYVYSLDEDKPLTPEWIENHERILGRGPGGENVERTRTRANDWLIDREMQRTQNFSGIPGTNTQDLAVQESMGPIVDRSREHLGSTDRAIITARRLLLEAIGDVEEGVNPQGSDPATYRGVRPVDMVVPHGTPWREVAEPLLVAAR
jgi:hypothetical protein